ncbi:MAG TPA: hypothetical protein VHL10_07125 [Nitrososphaera sp.]|jgi:hypothetical protein|nr:hypothetical protein [Nitrososphaera sp.]
MQQFGSEIARLDARVTGTELRLDQKITEAAQNSRDDRKEVMAAVDKVKDKLDAVIFVLREDAKRK